MSRPAPELLLYATEAAARKAGTGFCSDLKHHMILQLYQVLPAGEKKPTYLLGRGHQLLKAERDWIAENQAAVTKLGRFQTGISYMPLQRNMVRQRSDRRSPKVQKAVLEHSD